MPRTKAFAERLAALRKARGLTQLSLGAKAGLGSLAISRYERGEQLPRIDSAAALAEALGITVGELLDVKPSAAA